MLGKQGGRPGGCRHSTAPPCHSVDPPEVPRQAQRHEHACMRVTGLCSPGSRSQGRKQGEHTHRAMHRVPLGRHPKPGRLQEQCRLAVPQCRNIAPSHLAACCRPPMCASAGGRRAPGAAPLPHRCETRARRSAPPARRHLAERAVQSRGENEWRGHVSGQKPAPRGLRSECCLNVDDTC